MPIDQKISLTDGNDLQRMCRATCDWTDYILCGVFKQPVVRAAAAVKLMFLLLAQQSFPNRLIKPPQHPKHQQATVLEKWQVEMPFLRNYNISLLFFSVKLFYLKILFTWSIWTSLQNLLLMLFLQSLQAKKYLLSKRLTILWANLFLYT